MPATKDKDKITVTPDDVGEIPGVGGDNNPFAGPVNDPFADNGTVVPFDEDEEFNEDFSGETGSAFPIFTEGTFPAVVFGFAKTQSKRTGADQYEWEFKLAGGPDKGKRLRDWTSCAPAARWKIVNHLEALGIPAAGSIVRFRKSDIVGKPCTLTIFTDNSYTPPGEDKPREQSKIRSVNKPDDAAIAAAKELQDTPPV